MKSKKLFILFTALALSVTACNFGKKSSSKAEEPSSSNEPESSETSSAPAESSESTIAVTALALNKSELSLEETKSETLTVTVTPSNASNTKVNWESSNTEVATVSSLGKVTAKKVGTATITVSSVSNPEVTATCAVTVTVEGGTYGSLNKPLTVAKALALAEEECKEDGDFSKDQFYVKGYVSRQPSYNAEKGYSQSIYLKDDLDAEDGKEFLVYTANHDALKVPYKNDLIIVHGWVKLYKTTLEMANKSTEYPEVVNVTRGVSKITYSAEHGAFNADAPKVAENLTEIKFTVTATEGYKVDSVTANGTELTALEDGSYKVLVAGDMAIAASISEEGVDMRTATMAYQTESTTNMAEGNNAELVGLDPTLFNVESTKPTGIYAGLNKSKYIALYNEHADPANPTANGTTVTVSSTRATIKKVAITIRSSSTTGYTLAVKAGDTAVEAASDGSYEINAGSFSMQNASVSAESCQIHIEKVVISYVMNEEVPATAVALDKETLELEEGDSSALKATFTPANATDVVTWISSKEDVAKVEAGKVTAVGAGTATITAFIDANADGKLDEGELKAECAVTVTADTHNYGSAEAPLTVAEAKALLDEIGSGNVTKKQIFIKGVVSTNKAFNANSTPKTAEIWLQSEDGATEKAFELYSCSLADDIDFETYKAADALKGFEVVATGYATIYNSTYELTNANDASGTRVYPKILSAKAPSATAVDLDKDTLALLPTADATLVATLTPSNTADTVKWISSDTTVATVEDGKVTAVAVGTATITAFIDANGNDTVDEGELKAECAVTVSAESVAATSVAFNPDSGTLNLGSTLDLSAKVTVLPENHTTTTIIWDSSDKEVATVENGVVTPIKSGTTKITATVDEQVGEFNLTVRGFENSSEALTVAEAIEQANALADNKETTNAVNVVGFVKSIASDTYGNLYISDGTNEFYIYGTYDLYGTWRYDKLVSDKPEVGDIVVLNGKLKKYVKDATTTLQMSNARIKELNGVVCQDKVATAVELNKATAEVEVDDTLTLSVKAFTPTDSTSSVKWVSSDTNKATVNNAGKVTGVAVTEAEAPVTITAYVDLNGNDTVDEGEPKADCAVTVKAAPEVIRALPAGGLTIDYTSLALNTNGTYDSNKGRKATIGEGENAFDIIVDPDGAGVVTKASSPYTTGEGKVGVNCIQSKKSADAVLFKFKTKIASASTVTITMYVPQYSSQAAQYLPSIKIGNSDTKILPNELDPENSNKAPGVDTGVETGGTGSKKIYLYTLTYDISALSNETISILAPNQTGYYGSIVIA